MVLEKIFRGHKNNNLLIYILLKEICYMPIRQCRIDNKPGYKWGQVGKCYDYNPNDEESKYQAKRSAISQGIAIGDFEAIAIQVALFKGTYNLSVLEVDLAGGVGFDFDGVLSTLRGQTIARQTSAEVYIITARSASNLGGYYGTAEVYKIADKLNIPHSNVFFEGSNQRKIARVKQLGLSTFYDNNIDVINALPSIGKLF